MTTKTTQTMTKSKKKAISIADLKDRTGERYGKMTVIELVDPAECPGRREPCWWCHCDCGNNFIVPESRVESTLSCGCYAGDNEKSKQLSRTAKAKHNAGTMNIQKASEDDKYIGHHMSEFHPGSMLTCESLFAYYLLPGGQKVKLFKFKCDCGNTCIAQMTAVKNGQTLSCGCHKHCHGNNFVEHKDLNNRKFYTGTTNSGDTFMVDESTMNELVARNLTVHINKYVAGESEIRKTCTVNVKDDFGVMHSKALFKFVLTENGKDGKPVLRVLYINGNRLDVRKKNLRPLTMSEAGLKTQEPLPGKVCKNRLGVVGVKQTGSGYKATMTFNGEVLNLGEFSTFDDAVIARLDAEYTLLGEDIAPQRSMFKAYGINKVRKTKVSGVSKYGKGLWRASGNGKTGSIHIGIYDKYDDAVKARLNWEVANYDIRECPNAVFLAEYGVAGKTTKNNICGFKY